MGRYEIQAAPVCGRDVACQRDRACAQDSRFPPTGQQIPVLECLAVKDLWTGGVKLCSHES